MRPIGESIQEAIDWTQDRLGTTRPLAERTLFSLMAAKQVTETEQGFLVEAGDEELDDVHKRMKHLRIPKFHKRQLTKVMREANNRGVKKDKDKDKVAPEDTD